MPISAVEIASIHASEALRESRTQQQQIEALTHRVEQLESIIKTLTDAIIDAKPLK